MRNASMKKVKVLTFLQQESHKKVNTSEEIRATESISCDRRSSWHCIQLEPEKTKKDMIQILFFFFKLNNEIK